MASEGSISASWLRSRGSSIVKVVQGGVAVFQIVVIPYQMCMVPKSLISFNLLYVIG